MLISFSAPTTKKRDVLWKMLCIYSGLPQVGGSMNITEDMPESPGKGCICFLLGGWGKLLVKRFWGAKEDYERLVGWLMAFSCLLEASWCAETCFRCQYELGDSEHFSRLPWQGDARCQFWASTAGVVTNWCSRTIRTFETTPEHVG